MNGKRSELLTPRDSACCKYGHSVHSNDFGLLFACMFMFYAVFLLSTAFAQHDGRLLAGPISRVQKDWDVKYKKCVRDSNKTAESECFYDYCNIAEYQITVCDVRNASRYIESYGLIGQDCKSFGLIENYVMSGALPSERWLQKWCTGMRSATKQRRDALFKRKDWDIKYITSSASDSRRSTEQASTSGGNVSNVQDDVHPVYEYCDIYKEPLSTICSEDRDINAYIVGGGVAGQDCTSFGIIEKYILGLYEENVTFSREDFCVTRRMLVERAGCQEDSFACRGCRNHKISGYDLSKMTTVIGGRTGRYSDFHTHFHNSPSVIGVSPGGALKGCAFCHADGTEWNRPWWVMMGTKLEITRDFEAAWTMEPKSSTLKDISTRYPHIRTGGVFYGQVDFTNTRVVPTTTVAECTTGVYSSSVTTVLGYGRLCVATLEMVTFTTEREKAFRPICGCSRADPPFAERCSRV